MSEPTIVITAAAAITSLGTTRHETLDAMLRGEIGIRPSPALEARPEPDPGAGEAIELPASVGCASDRAEHMLARAVRAALAEAQLVGAQLEGAQLDGAQLERAEVERAQLAGRAPGVGPCAARRDARRPRVVTLLGTTIGGIRHWGAALRGGGAAEVRRLTAASVLAEALEGSGLPLGGITLCAACASGVTSVAAAAALLRLGEADIVLAGGYDPISEFALGGFLALKLVAPTALRPFGVDREGMKLGEGYGVLVMERIEGALARGVVPIAILAGTGEASDGHHLTQPHPDGAGAGRAMRAALADAGLAPDAIDLLAAHATATPANDEAEHRAYLSVFGEGLAAVPVVALKSRLGHALGAAGAIELALGIASLERGVIPPTANASVDRQRFPSLDLVAEPRRADLRRSMHLSLGFGGADACAIVERFDGGISEPRSPRANSLAVEPVVVTGVGVLLPPVREHLPFGSGSVDEATIDALVDARAARRLAPLSRFTRAVGVLATRDAGLTAENLAATHAIVATEHGAVGYTQTYYEELVRSGVDMGNPMYFAESVPNVASAQLSLGLRLGGATFTVVGSRLAGLEALHLAAARLRDGRWQRAIVVAVEEHDPLLAEWMTHFGLVPRGGAGAVEACREMDLTAREGTPRPIDSRAVHEPESAIGGGAVAWVLERDSERRRRGARALATIGRTGLAWPCSRRRSDRIRVAQELAASTFPGSPLVTPGADHWLGRLERRVARRHNGREMDVVPTAELHSITALLPLVAAIARNESAAVLAMDAYGGAAVAEVVAG